MDGTAADHGPAARGYDAGAARCAITRPRQSARRAARTRRTRPSTGAASRSGRRRNSATVTPCNVTRTPVGSIGRPVGELDGAGVGHRRPSIRRTRSRRRRRAARRSNSMSENASSRRSSSAISSVSDAVDNAGVHARTSSVYRRRERLPVAVDAGAQGPGSASSARAAVRGHLAKQLRFRRRELGVGQAPRIVQLGELLQGGDGVALDGSPAAARSDPAGRREPLLQLPVVGVLLRAVARAAGTASRSVEAGRGTACESARDLTSRGSSPSAPRTRPR